MLDNNEALIRNPPPEASFDREPLRRELDYIRSKRHGTEPTLELGKDKLAIRGRVGSIDLREQREWPLGVEQALGEFDAGVLQILGQGRALAELQSLPIPREHEGDSENCARGQEETNLDDHRALRNAYLAAAITGTNKNLANSRARGWAAM